MRSNDEPGFTSNLQAMPSNTSLRVSDLAQHVFHFGPVGPAEEALRIRYVEALQKHRDLDDTIARLCEAGEHDELLIARLKKRKLRTRDEMTQLEQQLQHAADMAVGSGPVRLHP